MLPLMEMVCYRLWKWYVTALGNLSKLPNTVCNRLWKWYLTALSSTCLDFVYHLSAPFMEVVSKRFGQHK
jgi:hypothetical protein